MKKSRKWLSQRAFNKLFIPVNESETAVILSFREPRTLSEALNIFPTEYEKDIKEYIQELIAKKIIIPVETTHYRNELDRRNIQTEFAFDMILSVGNDCRPAYYLKKNNLRHYKNPLDWVGYYSLDTVIHLYKTKFNDFFTDLIEDKQQYSNGYIDGKNNILFVHYDNIESENETS